MSLFVLLKGAEEKEGKGMCACDKGYAGVTCQSCDTRFYQEEEEEEEDGRQDPKLECRGQC